MNAMNLKPEVQITWWARFWSKLLHSGNNVFRRRPGPQFASVPYERGVGDRKRYVEAEDKFAASFMKVIQEQCDTSSVADLLRDLDAFESVFNVHWQGRHNFREVRRYVEQRLRFPSGTIERISGSGDKIMVKIEVPKSLQIPDSQYFGFKSP